MAPLVARWERVADAFLGPLRLQPLFAEPFSLASFGLKALCSARGLAESRFKGEAARAMFAGLCAHSMLPFERATSAAAGLVLGTLGHAIGWPLPRGGMPLSTGVFVLYSDDESFTLMTPQGHVFAGWITFSAHEEIGCTVAQAQVLMRANDPIYELGLRFGGHKQEDVFWDHTLKSLAEHFNVAVPSVDIRTVCIDRKMQWSRAGNILHNSAMYTMLYILTTPVRKIRKQIGRLRTINRK
jgi:hypothetical protein